MLSVSEKLFLHLYRQAAKPPDITYCESVFRKSLHENVEVFKTSRTIRNNTHFRIDTCGRVLSACPNIPYLSECGVLCRLFLVRSFHNLHVDKRD